MWIHLYDPHDPYDGYRYGYMARGTDYLLYSVGPDKRSWTNDDIQYESRTGKLTVVGGVMKLTR